MAPLDKLAEKWERERHECAARAQTDDDQEQAEPTTDPSAIEQLRAEPDDDQPWRRAR